MPCIYTFACRIVENCIFILVFISGFYQLIWCSFVIYLLLIFKAHYVILFIDFSGSIPGPVLFGKMIDLTCSLWQTKCDEQGSCFFYNNQNMSYYILAVALVCKTFALLFLFLSLCCYRTCPETSEDDDEVTSRTLTVSNDYVNKGFSDISDTNLENGSDKGSNVYYISSL